MGFSTIGDFAETPAGAGSTGHEGVDDQSSSNDDQLTIKDGEVVINEDGDDVDFRIESQNNANMLVVDGENDRIGIGTAAPAVLLTTAKVATDDSNSSTATLANSFVHLGQGEYGSGRYYLTTYGYSTGRTNPGAYVGALGAESAGYGKYHLVLGTRNATTDSLPTERMRIATTGNVGVGTTAPGDNLAASTGDVSGKVLHVKDTSSRANLVIEGQTGARIDMVDITGGSNTKWLRFGVEGEIGVFHSVNDNAGAFNSENILAMDLATGNVGIGTATPDSILEVSKAAADAEVLISAYHDTEATTPKITFRKADNTEASPALVDDNAVLGTVDFLGHDGTNFERGAKVEARVQGTSASNDLPTELTFWTTPDGSNTCQERLSIGADGALALAEIDATSPPSAVTGYAKIYALDDGAVADSEVKMLLHFDGANSGTTFTDSSQGNNTITRNGDPVTSTSVKKFGSASGHFDGNDDLQFPNLADFTDNCTGDFTYDFWIRFTAIDGARNSILGTGPDDIQFEMNPANKLFFGMRNASGGAFVSVLSAKSDFAENTWYYIMVTREGSELKIWIDGVLDATTTGVFTGAIQSRESVLRLGFYSSTSDNHSGYIDEFRFTNGTALQTGTSSFSVPTAATEGSAELYVKDELANQTRISPHNGKGEWEYYSKNTETGKTVRINMEEVVKDLGELTGKDYIKDK